MTRHFKPEVFNLNDCTDKALDNLSRLNTLYTSSDTTGKRAIIGSIYPEKLHFDGSAYRTAQTNQAAQLMFLINSKLGAKKNRTNLDLSKLVRFGSGSRTRTYDLRVMSPTSYQLLHPALFCYYNF